MRILVEAGHSSEVEYSPRLGHSPRRLEPASISLVLVLQMESSILTLIRERRSLLEKPNSPAFQICFL